MWALNNSSYSGFGDDTGDCRRYVVPTCEPDGDIRPTATIPAMATFTIRQRDVVDFIVDWSAWLAANGNPPLATAVWTIALNSPKTPVLEGQVLSAAGIAAVVLAPAAGALPGDAYWLDLTITTGVSPVVNPGDVAIPARTLVRRIYVIVTAG